MSVIPSESALLFDLTGWAVIELAGSDCATFLHNFCTNDIKKLAPDEGCEAFVTNVKARVLGHVFVFKALDPLRLTLLATPGQGEPLTAHFDRYVIREDVTIRDSTAESGLLYVAGPKSAATLQSLGIEAPAEPPEIGRLTSRTTSLGDRACTIRRVDLLGVPGAFIETARDALPAVRARLESAGASMRDCARFNALRIEAGFPYYGIDITADHLAPEVGRPWAISYTKGCYLGQEPIARIDALGHVNRRLCALRLDAASIPEPGSAVIAEGKEIGGVTSAAIDADGRAVALAYLRTKFAEPGTEVRVRTPAGEARAMVLAPSEPRP